ncbi:hypothetical protein M426DRAFT_321224 [Hypoxylon sp. CI-4A]|nr:hypothetical protein M426DRAFT_321224 [Hypoxylon sp. CI-4A]
MVFTPPAWVPQLPFDPPDSIPIHEFWSSERYGRRSLLLSRNPFTCGITGKTYTTAEATERYELLARSLAKRLGWRVNEGSPWDKVVGVYSFNSIDYMGATFAVHRLSGIVSPANAMYSAEEIEHQIKSAGLKAIITCVPLLETALKATRAAGLPDENVFIMQVGGISKTVPFKTLDDLIEEGRALPELEQLHWSKGQGARQVAYLAFSSGTSGLPKAVMIAHRNMIANMMQIVAFEEPARKEKGVETQVELGLLPLSHIYGLTVVAQTGTYRGDEVIILPKFELKTLLETIQKYKVNFMHLVPPTIIQLLRNTELCKNYDLTSVRFIYTGAAPLGAETHEEVVKAFPHLQVGQGYGMTETATVILSTAENDVMMGTSGSLVASTRAKLIGEDGHEVTELEKRGELFVQSPSVTLGYLNNEKATTDAYVYDDDGRWMRTGDVGIVRKAPSGNLHIAIVDRVKELIKVKGLQVAPAELEAHILSHPSVADCAVIPIPDEGAGEVPKAFVVKAPSAASRPDESVAQDVKKWVEDHKARYKWLKGGVEFLEAVPKSASGKILRRLLKDQEREKRRAAGAKL